MDPWKLGEYILSQLSFERILGKSVILFIWHTIYTIGEHIDYCGYGVLPMALEQDIAIACSLSGDGKYGMSTTVSNMK